MACSHCRLRCGSLVAPAGWVNQQQREVIDYLQEEKGLAGTTRPETSAVRGRSAPPDGGESRDAWTTRLAGHRHDFLAGHLAGLASSVDRAPIRRKRTSCLWASIDSVLCRWD